MAPSNPVLSHELYLGLHLQHDANLVIVDDGMPLMLLELERLFGERYMSLLNQPAWLAGNDCQSHEGHELYRP